VFDRRPIRIAVVSHSYIVNENRGKLDCLASLRGYEVLLIVPRRWKNRDTGQRFEASPGSRTALRVLAIGAWSLGSGSLITYSPAGLWSALRKFRPDVIHLEEEPWSLAALEMSVLSPLLHTLLTIFTWENIDKKLPFIFRAIRRWVLARACGAVAGSAEAGSLLQRHGFRGQTAVLPQLGVDVSSFRATVPRPPNVVGFVGRLVPQKGISVLLKALARMPVRCRALVVGNGPSKNSLERLAQELGLDGEVEFHNDVPHSGVPAYMARMTVLVLPSLTTPTWKEQFGHVLIEAMASGVPVIGSDSGAIPEVIADAGIIVREGDPDVLAVAVEQLLTTATLQDNLVALASRRVRDNYTNQVVAERLASFLMQVVDRVD
jgi:glycosyltransferase involved in cell wall biosynthesis